jgi:hypothetical protein
VAPRFRFKIAIFAIILLVACLSFLPVAMAEQTAEEAAALLTSGQWQFHGHARTFKADGTFTSDIGSHGVWKITGDELDITFSNGHAPDRFFLPIDPAGTKGVSNKNQPEVLSRIGPATSQSNAPEASSTPSLPLSPQQQAADAKTRAMLTTGDWQFHGHVRNFLPDGTFTSDNGSSGRWTLTATELDVRFLDNNAAHRFYLPLDPNGTHGVDNNGRPEMLYRAVIGQALNVPPDVQASAADLIKAYHDSLVFVTGSAGAGSGFIAEMGGTNWLITNVHVAAALADAQFQTLGGTQLNAGAPYIAVGEDLFRMALPPGGAAFQVMQNTDTSVTIGDWLVVLGNAEGGGVINTILGTVTGIGPQLVESDAQFVHGNSGSPMIDIKSGKVIGVATYMMFNWDDMKTSLTQPKLAIRRFGYRLDTVKTWQPVVWSTFHDQASLMDAIEGQTTDLAFCAFYLMRRSTGVILPYPNPDLERHIQVWREERSQNSSGKSADRSFAAYLKGMCESDIADADGQFTYDYFTRGLADQKQARDQLEQILEQFDY